MFNIMKKKQIYPDTFLPSNISSFWKNRCSKDELSSQRGVFNKDHPGQAYYER